MITIFVIACLGLSVSIMALMLITSLYARLRALENKLEDEFDHARARFGALNERVDEIKSHLVL